MLDVDGVNPTPACGKLRIEPGATTVDAKGVDARSQILNSYLNPPAVVDEDPELPGADRPAVQSSSPPSADLIAPASTTGTIELDLRCEREQCATVHTLRWATDARGRLRSKECTCNTCPSGANARPWPTNIELQDAGATSRVPPSEN